MSLPPESQTPPPLPAGQPRRLPLRKIILGVILAGSILLFILIVLAGSVAILREAAPDRHAGLALRLTRLCAVVRHVIVRHILPHHK